MAWRPPNIYSAVAKAVFYLSLVVNVGLSLAAIDVTQAADFILRTKKCLVDERTPIGDQDWGALWHVRLDLDSVVFVLPSLLIAIACLFFFKKNPIFCVAIAFMNWFMFESVFEYFQQKAHCNFDPHGEDGMVLMAYPVMAVVSVFLVIIYGLYLMTRGQGPWAPRPTA